MFVRTLNGFCGNSLGMSWGGLTVKCGIPRNGLAGHDSFSKRSLGTARRPLESARTARQGLQSGAFFLEGMAAALASHLIHHYSANAPVIAKFR
jgi:hypothetical protein